MDKLAIFPLLRGADGGQLENGHFHQNPTETTSSLTISAMALNLTRNIATGIPHVLKSEHIHF